MTRHIPLGKLVLVFCLHTQAVSSMVSADMGDRDAPLRIHTAIAEPRRQNQPIVLFVTLHNLNATEAITQLKLRVGTMNSYRASYQIPTLEARQSVVRQFAIPGEAGDTYVMVTFKVNGQPNSIASVAQRPIMQTVAVNWAAIISPLLSLLGVAVGAWLFHSFTKRREHDRAILEWGKLLFEKYEKGYRDFVQGWGGAPIGSLLRDQFELLLSNSFVPAEISKAYKKTYAVLSNPNASAAKKEEACNLLRQAIDRFMFHPWSHQTRERATQDSHSPAGSQAMRIEE